MCSFASSPFPSKMKSCSSQFSLTGKALLKCCVLEADGVSMYAINAISINPPPNRITKNSFAPAVSLGNITIPTWFLWAHYQHDGKF